MKQGEARTVLVIGGGVKVRDQLCLALSKEGCLIRVTCNEQAALVINAKVPSDVVLMDPAVSELGIPSFHKALLEVSPLSRLVLVVNANTNCKRLEWKGVNHFLKTPFNRYALLSAITIRRSERN